jgi:hypothetical protein
MATIKCPECMKPISETANACPQCGFPLTPEKVAVQKEKEAKDNMGCALMSIVIVVCFVIAGIAGRSSSSSSSSSSSTSSPTSPTSRSQYDEAADRQLKDLPSLQGYSDREKEQIISASKKLTNAVNELERQRGY